MGLGIGTLVVLAGLLLTVAGARPGGWLVVLAGVVLIGLALLGHRARHRPDRG